MNLAEFPLVLLTKRPPEGVHTIEYQDHDRHPRTGATVLRKVTITGAGKYGLPTIHDEDVLMALIYLTLADKSVNGFSDTAVRFTRRQLLQVLGWPDTGHYYDRIKQSIRRWKGLTIVYENWWDQLANEYIAEVGFSLLDNYKFFDGRRNDQSQLALPFDDSPPQRSLCSITWNKTPFASFKNGYLTTLDLDKFFSLPTAAAKRAYRYLNLRLPAFGLQDFDLQTFACQHVGFSTNYKPSRLRSEVQQAIVVHLEKNDFIESLPPKRRFLKQNGRDRIVFARKAPPALLPSQPDQAATPPLEAPPASTPSPLIRELTSRGLGGKLAARFVAAHPADYIEQKIDYFDFELATGSLKSPIGYLRRAIEEDYGPPAGYLPREERERQQWAAEEARRQQQQNEETERQRERETREQEACQKAERRAIAASWDALTKEQQAEHDAAAIAQANAEELKLIEPGPMKRIGMGILRDSYTRKLLQAQGKLPPAEA